MKIAALVILFMCVMFANSLQLSHAGKFCDESDDHINHSYNCNSQGKCWNWCGGNSHPAENAYGSDGKWCYTSGTGVCKSREDCAGYRTCFNSNCNTNC